MLRCSTRRLISALGNVYRRTHWQRQQHVGKQQQYDSDLQVCVPVLLCLYCLCPAGGGGGRSANVLTLLFADCMQVLVLPRRAERASDTCANLRLSHAGRDRAGGQGISSAAVPAAGARSSSRKRGGSAATSHQQAAVLSAACRRGCRRWQRAATAVLTVVATVAGDR
jgi:hypothetical protein